MIKVLIVDDETIARINLRYLANWEKEGFTIIGEADSGVQALEKVKELEPDVIFTDMNMPGMNGVEFIKNVRKIAPITKIIAFSAFEDFEFVRQSLKEGVIDYLVKHKLDAETLFSMLKIVKENIIREAIENQRMDQMKTMANSGKIFMRKNIVIDLLNGYLQGDFNTLREKYEICLEDRNLIVAAARIDNYFQLKERFTVQEFKVFIDTLDSMLSNICTEMGRSVHVQIEDAKFVFIMSFSKIVSEAKLYSEAMANISNIKNTIKRFLNISMSFGVSSLCPHINGLSHYYREATELLEKGYYKGGGYIIQKTEVENNNSYKEFTGLNVSDEKNILNCVRSFNEIGINNSLEEIFNNLKVKKCSFETVKVVSIDLINILQRLIKESNLTLDMFYACESNLYEEIVKFGNLEELLRWFKLLYNSFINLLKSNRIQNNYSIVVRKAIEYILNNYNKNISLSDVAANVNVSSQYLSKLFKEECGMGFVNYLNTVRIEHAKRIIAEGCELKSLTQKLGFNSYTYFFTVFKEITNMTPQQYEKQIMSKQ
jgi:two-component system response regulator YesN